ncbi:MAG: hypothetical protein K6B14_08815 [Lachnospiraceae bacterium]|nr:hypothetical protein [Lachnospiraceae bacterium]
MNEKNYIQKKIKMYYSKRILSPIVFLLAVMVLFVLFPIRSLLFPEEVDFTEISPAEYIEEHSHDPYITADFDNLYFTGYRETFMSQTIGYYYYTMTGDECVIILLTAQTCEDGVPTMEDVHLRARLMKEKATREDLLAALAGDLSWTSTGIENEISEVMLSEPDIDGVPAISFRAVVLLGIGFAVLSILFYAMWILFPILSPPIRRLSVYGRPGLILAEAEEELSTLPQLATEDIFITEHYFIETSDYGVAVVPISQIIWIYKYSTLHKFLWVHFAISYTLHISAGKHQYIRCPKNTKTDIDGIMDYLAEANHDILVGFSEENRRLANTRARWMKG